MKAMSHGYLLHDLCYRNQAQNNVTSRLPFTTSFDAVIIDDSDEWSSDDFVLEKAVMVMLTVSSGISVLPLLLVHNANDDSVNQKNAMCVI